MIARWRKHERKTGAASVVADGPRICWAALFAANLQTSRVDRPDLDRALGTLKQIIDQNLGANEKPEFF